MVPVILPSNNNTVDNNKIKNNNIDKVRVRTESPRTNGI